MNPLPELVPYLKRLRLSGILDSLDARNRQAIDSKLAYTEFLALLVEDEVARREQKKFQLRLRRAAFRTTKTLEQFDFERLPQLNRALVHELATGRYLSDRAPVLIVGPCGTGKSHLAQIVGCSLIFVPWQTQPRWADPHTSISRRVPWTACHFGENACFEGCNACLEIC